MTTEMKRPIAVSVMAWTLMILINGGMLCCVVLLAALFVASNPDNTVVGWAEGIAVAVVALVAWIWGPRYFESLVLKRGSRN